MAAVLTQIAIEKQAKRFYDSVVSAKYTINSIVKDIELFKKEINGTMVKVYVYFDDSIEGAITNISLVDVDGDIVAVKERTFTKTIDKGLYILFQNTFTEGVEVNGAL